VRTSEESAEISASEPTGAAPRAARAGVADMLPVVAGLAPLGLVVGAAAADAGSPAAALVAAVLVYGASAQLALADAVGRDAALLATVGAMLLVNARLVLYSASMAPDWRGESVRYRVGAAALLVDPAWALARARYDAAGTTAERRRYYTGAALTLLIGWLALNAAGMALGDALASCKGAGLALPLCMSGLLVPMIHDRTARAVAAAAIASTLVVGLLAPDLALPAAIVGGVAAGRATADRAVPA
jgi:predicted branched-subunit amino acid permease